MADGSRCWCITVTANSGRWLVGCSGGSEQAHPISDDYPGLLDGIVVGCSFPELIAGISFPITDADLFLNYLQHRTTLTWSEAQIVAATAGVVLLLAFAALQAATARPASEPDRTATFQYVLLVVTLSTLTMIPVRLPG